MPKLTRRSAPEDDAPPVPVRERFTGAGVLGPTFAPPIRLQRAMLAAGLSRAAIGTLEVLYHYVFISCGNGQMNDAGECLVWPSRATVAAAQGCSVRAISRHFDELAAVGAIRRDDIRWRRCSGDDRVMTELWVRSFPHLYSLLMRDDAVRTRFETMFPFATHDNVVSLADPTYSDAALTAVVDSAITQQKRSTMDAMTRRAVLDAALTQATSSNAEAHERAQGKAAKRPPKRPVEAVRVADDPVALLSMLRACIKQDLESVQQPHETKANQMTLWNVAKQYGCPATRRLIEFVTQPDHWAALRARFRVRASYPSPAVLAALADEWVPIALGHAPLQAPAIVFDKRLGGTDPADLARWGVAQDENDF